MSSPTTCTCGIAHADGCPGRLGICISQGRVFDWTFRLTNRLTGADQDWPAGTTGRIVFTWGTGTELIIPLTIDGPYLRIHLTNAETEQIPRAAWATIELNYDSGDPDMWRPWRKGRVSPCR